MGETDVKAVAAEVVVLRSTMDTVLTREQVAELNRIQAEEIWSRLREAHVRDAGAWARVEDRADWEAFRDERMAALARSLGDLPRPGAAPEAMVTGDIQGEGFRIENVVFAGHAGLPHSANLYLPDPVCPPLPAIIICPSHHNPKTHTELQDMGMTWARAGAAVLMPENLGHGERRQQPFGGREDYHSRYVMGMQLYLVGESLMGFFVADLMRAVDFLCARPGIDRNRIVLIGSVAGGGDPAAVTAALDGRIACSIPFNFGAGSMIPGGPADPAPAGDAQALDRLASALQCHLDGHYGTNGDRVGYRSVKAKLHPYARRKFHGIKRLVSGCSRVTGCPVSRLAAPLPWPMTVSPLTMTKSLRLTDRVQSVWPSVQRSAVTRPPALASTTSRSGE